MFALSVPEQAHAYELHLSKGQTRMPAQGHRSAVRETVYMEVF